MAGFHRFSGFPRPNGLNRRRLPWPGSSSGNGGTPCLKMNQILQEFCLLAGFRFYTFEAKG
jgi:hypothetical protein